MSWIWVLDRIYISVLPFSFRYVLAGEFLAQFLFQVCFCQEMYRMRQTIKIIGKSVMPELCMFVLVNKISFCLVQVHSGFFHFQFGQKSSSLEYWTLECLNKIMNVGGIEFSYHIGPQPQTRVALSCKYSSIEVNSEILWNFEVLRNSSVVEF